MTYFGTFERLHFAGKKMTTSTGGPNLILVLLSQFYFNFIENILQSTNIKIPIMSCQEILLENKMFQIILRLSHARSPSFSD